MYTHTHTHRNNIDKSKCYFWWKNEIIFRKIYFDNTEKKDLHDNKRAQYYHYFNLGNI
jgi:hypothetical protein